MPLPRKGRILSYFVVSDTHSLQTSYKCLDILFQHLKLVPYFARRVIILGDLLENEVFSQIGKNNPYKKWIRCAAGVDEYFYPGYKKEIEWGNWFFDKLKELAVEIIWVEGNHNVRLSEFLKQCPMSQRHLFNFKKDLKLKERNIGFIPYPDYLDIGNIAMTHGHLTNVRFLESHIKETGYKDILIGHLHKDHKECFKSRDRTVKAYSLPCMRDDNPDWLKGKPNAWTLGYARVLIRDDGNYNLYIYNIENNCLVLDDGSVLKGKRDEQW